MSLKKYLEAFTKGQKLIMNNYVTEAINLKSYNLSETDKIVVMYSKEKGLIKVNYFPCILRKPVIWYKNSFT